MDPVLYQKKNGVALITLNRPDSMNALSSEVRSALFAAMARADKEDDVAAIVLTGKGRKAFCAGLDLKELSSSDTNEAERSSAIGGNKLPESEKILIAAVNGYAITGGFELALHADFMIASENARFADTHSQVGIVPGWGLSQKLPRLININRAREISYTGRFVGAEEAVRIGLVNRVVPADQLLDVCQKIGDIAAAEPHTLQKIKHITEVGYNTTLLHGLDIETRANALSAKSLTPAFLAERRKIVMSRNRTRNQHAKL